MDATGLTDLARAHCLDLDLRQHLSEALRENLELTTTAQAGYRRHLDCELAQVERRLASRALIIGDLERQRDRPGVRPDRRPGRERLTAAPAPGLQLAAPPKPTTSEQGDTMTITNTAGSDTATTTARLAVVSLAMVLLGVSLALLPAAPADAATNPSGDAVTVYNPIVDGDSVHNDVSAWWAWGHSTAPASHHCVYTYRLPGWSRSYRADWCMDVFAREAGKRFVTPFGSRTRGGDRVISRVRSVRAGCASGNPADGGYVVEIDAINARTGRTIARASIMHVDRPQIRSGQDLGGWTTIGFTSRFRYSSCYQVTSDWGIHGHLEVVNAARYACWYSYNYQQPLTELTKLGLAGTNHSGSRARC